VPPWHVDCLVLKQRQIHYSYSAVSPTTKWPVPLCCRTYSLLSTHARVHQAQLYRRYGYKTIYYNVFYLLVVSLGFALFHLSEASNFKEVPRFFENLYTHIFKILLRCVYLSFVHSFVFFSIRFFLYVKETEYVGKLMSELQIQVASYVFELSAENCHR
jgi:hypothetical protein